MRLSKEMARKISELGPDRVDYEPTPRRKRIVCDETEVTGTLERYHSAQYGPHTIYWGNIHGDKKGRFRDGTFIHTSNVLEEFDCMGDRYIQTLNSLYKLGEPLKEVE